MNILYQVLLVGMLATYCPNSLAADEMASWCQYRQGGLMMIPVQIDVLTNGAVVARGHWNDREQKQTKIVYDTILSPAEMRYLALLIGAADFTQQAPAVPYFGDGGFWVSARQNGVTNNAYLNDDTKPGLVAMYLFFSRLVTQAKDATALDAGLSCPQSVRGWLQPEKAVPYLKRYVGKKHTWESVSNALQALSGVMTAEEWVGHVALCLDEADEDARERLLFALTTDAVQLQASIPPGHRGRLQPLLKKWNPSGRPTPYPVSEKSKGLGAAK